MDVLRKQAIAMAMLWLTGRDYSTEGGQAWFHIRASDLGLHDAVLHGKRIRVTIEAESEAAPITTTSWGSLTDEEVLRIAPMVGDFSAEEKAIFCGGFRRCAQALFGTK